MGIIITTYIKTRRKKVRMNYCVKCGNRHNLGDRFCTGCGAPISITQASENDHGTSNINQSENQIDAGTGDNVKLFSIIAYIIFFIPLIAGAHKTSNFVKFHTNQGTLLAITYASYLVLRYVLKIISSFFSPMGLIVGFAFTLIGVGFLVLAIVGIVNAANDKMVPLPVIGNFAIIK